MATCSKPDLTIADLKAAGRAAKQQKLTSAEHSIDPLSEAGVLQRVLGYVGPGHFLLMALISKEWRESYLQVPEQHIIEHDHDAFFQTYNVEFTGKPRMTLLKAAVASAFLMKLACDCGLPIESSRLQFIVGRWGDIATLSAAFECGMPQSPYICDGAARGGCLAELRWLVIDQRCPMHDTISVQAAASGSVATLNFLKQCNTSFTVQTARSAAAAGHQHVIEYLHAEGCPFDDAVYLAAAKNGHVPVLQRLRELDCAWYSAHLCTLAASRGLVHVLQWAKQQGAVFNEDTMAHAAAYGHIAVCEYLLAQQCPCDDRVCFAAASCCQLETLRWLFEQGCPYNAEMLWITAAEHGHISILSLLQQIDVNAPLRFLSFLLFIAGANGRLAAAQWLRAQGAAWPPRLSMAVEGNNTGERKQWQGAVLEWARAEGCTAPLQ
jgi:hypothetical protein